MSVNTSSYYLDDVVGGSDQSGFLSSPTRSMDQEESRSRPPSSVTREQTFLSPFSTLLRRPGNNAMDDPNVTISLQECRHVSVVVQVHEPTKNASSDQLPQLCLFPLVGDAKTSSMSQTLTEEADRNRHVVICVNPTAFGKSLPAQVTMETARLVAQVANIESEDWVRKYRYDEVLWSNRKEVVVDHGLFRVATGIAQDAVCGRGGGTLLTMGDKKMSTLFGMKAVSRMQAFTPSNLAVSDLGMMGMVYSQVLEGLNPDAVMTLSILEVVDEDSMRDLLDASRSAKTSLASSLRLRHIDRFPRVEGLSSEPVDSLRGLFHLVKRALAKKPRGHVLCFMSIWEDAVDQSLVHSTNRTLLTFGSLSSGHIPPGATALEKRRMAFMRKSLNGLRGVLRGSMTATTSSWRETLLNELLQESLFSGKAVVVASVAAESEAYERSLHTLDYVHRVLLTTTAQSPYLASGTGGRKTRTESSISSTSSPEELVKSFGGESTLLRSITTDPRQRLAKLMKTTPAKPRRLYVSSKDDDSDEEYKPTNYMAVDPGNISFFDPPSESFLEYDKLNPDSPFRKLEEYEEERKNIRKPAEKPSPSRSVQLESTDLFQDAWKAGQDDYEDAEEEASEQTEEAEQDPATNTPYSMFDPEPEDASPDETPEEAFFTPMTDLMPDPARQLWQEAATIEEVDEANEIPESPVVPEPEEVDPKEPSLDEELVKEWLEDAYSDPQPPPRPAFESPAKRYPPVRRIASTFDPPERYNWKEPRSLEDPDGMPFRERPPDPIRAPESPPAKENRSKALVDDDNPERDNRRETVSARTTPTEEETPEPTPSSQRTMPRIQQESLPPLQDDDPFVTKESKREFRREIHSIQEAVEEIRTAHSGLWVSSSASLERLQAFQDSQLMIMDEAVAGRRRAEEQLDTLKLRMEQLAQDSRSVRHQYQEQIADLEKKLAEAAGGRMDVERIAEDAIAGQDRAEARLLTIERALDDSKAALAKKQEELENARKSTKQTLKDLQETQANHDNIAMEQRDRARRVSDLEEELRDLSAERDRLEAALNGSGLDVDEAKTKLSGVAAQLRASKAESSKWKQRCDDLNGQLKALRDSLSNEKDAAVSLAKMETTNLEQELVACRRRIVDLETSKSSFETTAEIERRSLKERLEAEVERADRLQAEVDTSRTSQEMQEGHLNHLLQARLDEARQLRRDLDRARTERDAAKKHMTSLKAGIEKFQRETKDQVKSFIEEKKAAEAKAHQVEEEYKERILRLEREVEGLSASLRDAEQRKVEYESRIEELERQLAAQSLTRRETDQLKEKYDAVAREASAARKGLSEKDVEVQNLRMELDTCKRQLEQQQQANDSISTSHRETEQLKNEYKDRVEQLERQVSRLSVNERSSERLKERCENAIQEASSARTDAEQKEMVIQQLTLDLELLKRQLSQQEEAGRSISLSHREAEHQKNEYKDRVDQLERQLARVSANAANAERLKERYESAIKEARAAHSGLEKKELEIHQLKLELELLGRKMDQQDEASRTLSSAHREAEQLNQNYKNRIERLERQLSSLNERYENAASSALSGLENKEVEIHQLKLDLELLKRQLEKQEATNRTISTSHRESEHLNEEYRNRIDRLERQISSLAKSERNLERLKERYDNATREADLSRTELDKKEMETQQLRKELESLKHQLDQQDEASRALSVSQRELSVLKEEYKERAERLERELARLSMTERETDRLKDKYESASLDALSARKEVGEKETEIHQLRLDLDISKRRLEQQEQASRASQSLYDDERMALNRHKIRHLERENEELRSEMRTSSVGIVTLTELRAEQSRRLEAEDLIAIMAQRAKQSLEDRDEEVRSLKQMLCIQMEEKEAENRILRDRLLDRDRSAIEGSESGNRRARPPSSSLHSTERRSNRGT